MSLIVNKLDLKDIVMVIGIISSICGAAVAFAINSERIETSLKSVQAINNELDDNRRVNQEQNLILERVTINMNYMADQIKEIKNIAFEVKQEERTYQKNKDALWRR